MEFESLDALDAHLASGGTLAGGVFQGLDLRGYTNLLLASTLEDTVFLGCAFAPEALSHVLNSAALLFPQVPNVPYHPYRSTLYTVETLLDGYKPGHAHSYHRTTDGRIYRHFQDTGGPHRPHLLEALARRLHDHAITDALEDLIKGRHVVAIMGGHGLGRDRPEYLKVARIARALTQAGFLIASGGGPGAMEAANLGAWFASRPTEELETAVQMLRPAPHYDPIGPWLDAAFAVRQMYPLRAETAARSTSLGIPTWHYGHEPPNVFATHIAKYFANSVREDGLLSIATGGIVFAPGSAGTIQEIFQDAAQNHYNTVGIVSPMIFLGRTYWTREKPVYPLLRHLADGHLYGSLLALTDDPNEVLHYIRQFAATRSDVPERTKAQQPSSNESPLKP